MSIGINVKGGPNFAEKIGTLDKGQARQTLQKMQAQLASSKSSGVLTLFNRTNIHKEMKLERKSGFQLFFRSQKRIDDTAKAITTLLKQAELPAAVAAVEQYLKDSNKNRIDSAGMQQILDQHLHLANDTGRAGGSSATTSLDRPTGAIGGGEKKAGGPQGVPEGNVAANLGAMTKASEQSSKVASVQSAPATGQAPGVEHAEVQPSTEDTLQRRQHSLEKFAIRGYTNSNAGVPYQHFRVINDYLRNGCNFEKLDDIRKIDAYKSSNRDLSGRQLFLENLNYLRSGLAKLPDFRGEVYRGAALTIEQLDKYEIGQAISEPAFTSTSVDKKVALGFGKWANGEDGMKHVLFTIQSRHGKDISSDGLKYEKEVLLTAGSRFQVTGRSENSAGVVEIYLSEKE